LTEPSELQKETNCGQQVFTSLLPGLFLGASLTTLKRR